MLVSQVFLIKQFRFNIVQNNRDWVQVNGVATEISKPLNPDLIGSFGENGRQRARSGTAQPKDFRLTPGHWLRPFPGDGYD